MILLRYSIVLLTILLNGCSGSSNAKEETTDAAMPESSNWDCIFSYMDKYDQLLPLEVIQKHYKGDMSSAKMKYNKSPEAKGQKQDTYVYHWKGDRTKTMQIGGQKMVIPLDNEIGIKWLGDDLYKIMNRENPVASFKAFYHTPTKEELDAAFTKAEAKISEDKNVKEENKSTAMDMAKGMAAGVKYEDVNGLGDAASWDVRDNALIILIGTKTFKIVASVSADSEANKELAIELAKEVLVVCN